MRLLSGGVPDTGRAKRLVKLPAQAKQRVRDLCAEPVVSLADVRAVLLVETPQASLAFTFYTPDGTRHVITTGGGVPTA